MRYRIEIWQYHNLVETFESNHIKDVLDWYREEWKMTYDYGNCTFYVYKNNKRLYFDEKNKLGFFND